MFMHHLKHLLSETLALGVLVFPVAIILVALVGLASWMIAGQEVGLRASWITWCATMGVVPISLRLLCGPDTRVTCDRCISALKRRLSHLFGTVIQKENRRHPRYRVDLPATLFTDRSSGFVTIGNISAGGCRVESKVPVTTGDFGQLLIDLPGLNAPLKVSQATVRWVRGNQCGLEFIRMDPHEEGWFNRLIGQLGVGPPSGLSTLATS